jgi:hypothetical protein
MRMYRSWILNFGVGGWLLGTISVPLYDSSLPEDNSEVTCVAGQRRHQPTANGQ